MQEKKTGMVHLQGECRLIRYKWKKIPMRSQKGRPAFSDVSGESGQDNNLRETPAQNVVSRGHE
jgi:hypothetical protein